MKKTLLNVVLGMSMATLGFGQSQIESSASLSLTLFNQDGHITSSQILNGVEATNFDVKSYINANLDAPRVAINGQITRGNTLEYINYNGTAASNTEEVCEQTLQSIRPFFGVSGVSTELFDGLRIDKVADQSPAKYLGLVEGDIITSFNHVAIGTLCDLKMEVNQSEVGQKVEVTILRDGKSITKMTTVGGKIINHTSFAPCTIENLTIAIPSASPTIEMAVYPNPTQGMANLKFSSPSENQVTFYVLDINGALTHKEIFNVFTGSIHANYAFDNVVEGTYLFVIEQDGKTYNKQVVHVK